MKTSNELDRVAAAFEERASRAEKLAEVSEAAQAPLQFATGLYRAQSALARAIAKAHRGRPLTGRLGVDSHGFVEAMRSLLGFAAAAAPDALAAIARERAQEESSLLCSRLTSSWADKSEGPIDYLSRALLRPYLETLAALGTKPEAPTPRAEERAARCPFCGGPPWISARRPAADSDGAQRYLGCALCGGQWTFNRLRCPACSEENPDKLPSFRSDRYPAVRIEACETCHAYVKSLDLTEDGRLIPEVDDLVSLAMDLWAIEKGFRRIEPGLAGV